MKTRFIEQVNPEICEKITTLSFTTFKDIISTYKGQMDIKLVGHIVLVVEGQTDDCL